MLRRILSSEKIVKGEGRIKYRNLFQIFFIPRRILSYSKIVKGESRKPSLLEFFAGLSPFLDPASQRGVTCSHTAPQCGIQKKFGQESPQNTFPFTFLSGPRVAARGDAWSYRTPMRYPGKDQARVSAKSIPFTSLSGPASQRGVTLSVIPHPDAVSRKSSSRSVRKIHFLLRPSLDLASQRGVTRSHTAPRCGIHPVCCAVG